MKEWLNNMSTHTAQEANEKCWTRKNFVLRDGLVYRKSKDSESLVVDEGNMFEKIVEIHNSLGHGTSYRSIARNLCL